ncbi:hypothetical protein BAE41_29460 [Mesorhizobium loti]|nr:hypothetical protein BAE41_29460 [Mesorhizobium loti]
MVEGGWRIATLPSHQTVPVYGVVVRMTVVVSAIFFFMVHSFLVVGGCYSVMLPYAGLLRSAPCKDEQQLSCRACSVVEEPPKFHERSQLLE